MKVYNLDDKEFINSKVYKEFISEYPGQGTLVIRAYSASGAIPVRNLNIVVSTEYNGDKIVFFNGKTDESGSIKNIFLPTPASVSNDLDVPKYLTYDVNALNDFINESYKVNLYDKISVLQNINVIPGMEKMNYVS